MKERVCTIVICSVNNIYIAMREENQRHLKCNLVVTSSKREME